MNLTAVDYNALEVERTSEIQQQFEVKLAKRIAEDNKGLRGLVLQSVVEGRYDSAVTDLGNYVRDMDEFPNFQARIERYQQHCEELIRAIEAKRNYPGISALSVSKQHEIFEKVIEHFDELRGLILRIEATGHEVRLDDIRSTVIFIKALVYSVGIVVAVAFALDLYGGVLENYEQFMAHVSKSLTDFLFDKLGL